MTGLAIIPAEAVEDDRLSAYDLRVLCAISRFTNDGSPAAYTTAREKAQAVRISRSQFFDSARRLIQLGYIRRTSRAGQPSLYEIPFADTPVIPRRRGKNSGVATPALPSTSGAPVQIAGRVARHLSDSNATTRPDNSTGESTPVDGSPPPAAPGGGIKPPQPGAPGDTRHMQPQPHEQPPARAPKRLAAPPPGKSPSDPFGIQPAPIPEDFGREWRRAIDPDRAEAEARRRAGLTASPTGANVLTPTSSP